MKVLFDFDGVLLDSRENMRVSWEGVQREFNLSNPFEDYFQHIGKPFPNILDELKIEERRLEIQNKYFEYTSKNLKYLSIYPGVYDLLRYLQNESIKYGILTSKSEERTIEFVSHFGLNVLAEDCFCPVPELKGKPAPDLFFKASKQWKTELADVLYVGDMAVDEMAASAAGAKYVHAEWGYGSPSTENCTKISSPAHLQEYVSTAGSLKG